MALDRLGTPFDERNGRLALGKISLLLADIDGTLVGRKVLAERAITAVRAFKGHSMRFAVTSSRPPCGLAMLIETDVPGERLRWATPVFENVPRRASRSPTGRSRRAGTSSSSLSV